MFLWNSRLNIYNQKIANYQIQFSWKLISMKKICYIFLFIIFFYFFYYFHMYQVRSFISNREVICIWKFLNSKMKSQMKKFILYFYSFVLFFYVKSSFSIVLLFYIFNKYSKLIFLKTKYSRHSFFLIFWIILFSDLIYSKLNMYSIKFLSLKLSKIMDNYSRQLILSFISLIRTSISLFKKYILL